MGLILTLLTGHDAYRFNYKGPYIQPNYTLPTLNMHELTIKYLNSLM